MQAIDPTSPTCGVTGCLGCSEPMTFRFCNSHTCEENECKNPTDFGKKFCHQCACAQRGCVHKRSVYRRHKFCLVHGCRRCTTRPSMEGRQKCEDCDSRCHDPGNMCNASRARGSLYCDQHTCQEEGCFIRRHDYQSYCSVHKCSRFCREKKSPGEDYCESCLQKCLALDCGVARPPLHKGAYYCDKHGCAECHKERRHSWYSCRNKVFSTYCREHYEADLKAQHVVYEVYKRRKMVEATAVVNAGGDPETLEHAVFCGRVVDRMPRVVTTEKAWDAVSASVSASVVAKEWKDDLFASLMEYFPQSLPPSLRAEDSIEDVVRALSPLSHHINTATRSSTMAKYCDYDYGLIRLPRVCPTTVAKKRRVVCKGTKEPMYRLSGIVRKRGTDLYHDADAYFAWTVPVAYVNAFGDSLSIEKGMTPMLRFEEIDAK